MDKSIKSLALYVHDFNIEIGHSNSLIELIRNLPEEYLNNFKSIEVVAYSTSDLKTLFPEYKGELRWKKVWFPIHKPFIIKSIFYQLYTYIYNKFIQSKNTYRIGIGISCLAVDAVSVQFVHHQWRKLGLEFENKNWIRLIYKKFLFSYYDLCEDYLFSNKSLKIFSPAKFISDFLEYKYKIRSSKTIYSGVNLKRFELLEKNDLEIYNDLIQRYPQLQKIDINKPIFLFVGAYERKGLDRALKIISHLESPQIIIIGSASMGKQMNFPQNIITCQISFSKELQKFYTISDTFIFPTYYEPFGLVIFEAMAMGLRVITNYKNVGASELLEGICEVEFCDSLDYKLIKNKKYRREEKIKIRNERLNKLGDIGWKKSSQQLVAFLENNV